MASVFLLVRSDFKVGVVGVVGGDADDDVLCCNSCSLGAVPILGVSCGVPVLETSSLLLLLLLSSFLCCGLLLPLSSFGNLGI